MSTSAYIGIRHNFPEGERWTGLRVNWDGDPATIGEWLATFPTGDAAREGIKEMLTGQGWDWRSISADEQEAYDDEDDCLEWPKQEKASTLSQYFGASYSYLIEGETVTVIPSQKGSTDVEWENIEKVKQVR